MDVEVVSVHGHGKAPEEYVILKVLNDCSLQWYMLIDTTYSGKTISKKNRHSFWFPKKDVLAGDVIELRTKPGDNSWSTAKSNRRHTLYWGLKTPVWNDTGDGACLLKLSAWNTTKVK